MTEVKRVKLVQPVPLGYLELPPCSHHTQGCLVNEGLKERKATQECLENWAGLENLVLGDPRDLRGLRDKTVHMGLPEQQETLVLLDLPAFLVPVASQAVWVCLA